MAVQTSYSVYHAAKYAGAVNSVNPYATESKLNTDTVNIPFGYGVIADGETGMILPSTGDTAADFVGVSMRELNRAYADGETFGAPVGRDGTVVTHGRVAVVAVLDFVVLGEAGLKVIVPSRLPVTAFAPNFAP